MPDTEFKVRVIRMLYELKGRIDELTENLNKDSTMIKDLWEMKTTAED